MSATQHRCTVYSGTGSVLLEVQARKRGVRTRSTVDVVNLPKLNRSDRWHVVEGMKQDA